MISSDRSSLRNDASILATFGDLIACKSVAENHCFIINATQDEACLSRNDNKTRQYIKVFSKQMKVLKLEQQLNLVNVETHPRPIFYSQSCSSTEPNKTFFLDNSGFNQICKKKHTHVQLNLTRQKNLRTKGSRAGWGGFCV